MQGKTTQVCYIVTFCLLAAAGAAFPAGQTPFRRMDLDGDGRLSRAEFRGPPRAFRRVDRNGDGYISLGEAKGTPLESAARRSLRGDAPARAKYTASPAAELKYIDTHNHLVGRSSEGPPRRFDYDGPARAALEEMDRSGVKLNLVMPMPQTVRQKRRLYLDDILPVVKKHPGRFAVLGGGGSLNVMIQKAVAAGKVTEADKKDFDAAAAVLVKKGAVGFGEMTAEHFSMRSGHPYVSAPPDHPLFLRLADLAARYDIPIDLHMEAIPEKMTLPPRFRSPPNPGTLTPNIAGLERLLAHNRKARIVWVHLGWDNTGRRTVGLTRELLSRHPNLFMSVRVAGGMQAGHGSPANFPLDAKGALKPEWLALFKEFPDRFVIGSDEIITPGNRHPSAGSIRSTVGLLAQLPQDLRRAMGSENARRIYKLPTK